MSGSNLPAHKLMRYLEARFSVSRAVYASRAALGLFAVLECWRRRHGVCRVALPGAICHEVVLAVLAAGCEPIFCDVDVADGLVKDDEWAKARALGANAAIVVHLYGNPARMRHVRSLFAAFPDGLIVDDAAQALGAISRDGPAGAVGDVGLLSFGQTKQMSIGNAALLFHDPEFAGEVETVLGGFMPVDESLRSTLTAAFRTQSDRIRARLREEGDQAAQGFAGMLDGMAPVLFTPVSEGIENRILKAFEAYPEASNTRIAKAKQWSECLAHSGLEPIGMKGGSVPWRYACRLPGIDWSTQYRLANAMRATGMHVGNGYLPAHWFLGYGVGTLPGVEAIAREAFLFWVDEATSHAEIAKNAEVVHGVISSRRELEYGSNI